MWYICDIHRYSSRYCEDYMICEMDTQHFEVLKNIFCIKTWDMRLSIEINRSCSNFYVGHNYSKSACIICIILWSVILTWRAIALHAVVFSSQKMPQTHCRCWHRSAEPMAPWNSGCSSHPDTPSAEPKWQKSNRSKAKKNVWEHQQYSKYGVTEIMY